jgi:hypothetical protein
MERRDRPTFAGRRALVAGAAVAALAYTLVYSGMYAGDAVIHLVWRSGHRVPLRLDGRAAARRRTVPGPDVLARIDFLAETPNYNVDRGAWALDRLEALVPGEGIERAGLRLVKPPSGFIRIDRASGGS